MILIAIELQPLCFACKNAVFCPTWGQYKCTKFCKVIYDVDILREQCFEKSKTSILDKKCRCETCLERGDLVNEMEEQGDNR